MHLTSCLLLLALTLIVSTVAGVQPYQNVILLNDNTEKDVDIGKVSEDAQSGPEPVSYALLQSPVSKYFRVDTSTGRLMTKQRVDRDRLCIDSALCCVNKAAGPQSTSVLSNSITSGGGRQEGSVCSLQLGVAVTAGHESGLSPKTYSVLIRIQDENDHAPVFILPNQAFTPNRFSASNLYGISSPLLVLNISEAARVGTHRLRLPLATDLDAPPLNVKNYVVGSNGFPEKLFKLDVIKLDRSPSLSSFPLEELQDNAPITSLDLVLIGALDREKISSFEFQIIAIDGCSSSPKTGTLSVKIQVTDANDNVPKFRKSAYEVYVNESEVSAANILRVFADDLDEGENAQVIYSWLPDKTRFHDNPKLLEVEELTDRKIRELCGDNISPDHLARLQALPNYWFRLDSKTGEIFVHRPLDYETKRGFVFFIQARNPKNIVTTGGISSEGNELSSTAVNPQSTAKVTINVRNLNDERPHITVDYLGSEGAKYKTVMENGKPGYFIALIRAADRDAALTKPGVDDDPYMMQSSGYIPMTNSGDSQLAGGIVSCSLANYRENYTLHERQTILGSGSEYELVTRTPLDREREQRQLIKIECYDDGKPPKYSNATVEVHILDDNDCNPVIEVHSPAASRTSHLLPTVPRSHLSQILSQSYPSSFLPPPLGIGGGGTRLPDHPLVYAYFAGIPVVALSVPENKPSGTLVASVRASDRDAGENGRVTYRIRKEDFQLQMVSAMALAGNRATGQYPEAELDHSRQPVVVTSDIEAVEMFQLEANGDITTRRVFDREEFSPIQDEKYLLVEAQDHGEVPHTSYVLLAIQIEDENDYAPVFVMPQMNFTVLENHTAPRWIGDLLVFDHDMGTRMPPHEDPLPSKEHTLPRISKPVKNSINLIINPGHGLPDLPFVIDMAPDGRFVLNVTRTLDREVEDHFLFNVLATDYGGTRQRTATASILVTVADTNDNPPEIIFPRPATALTNLEKISFREAPGHVILSINAKDRDFAEENKAIRFDLGAPISNIPLLESDYPGRLAKTAMIGDLFKVDSVKGLLQTQRRMTEADLGEHWLQLIVRDLGNPPLETYQVLRLEVDRSPSNRIVFDNGELMDPNLEQGQFFAGGRSDFGMPRKDWNSASRGTGGNSNGSIVSDIVLFVIISLMLATFFVIIGVCIYLRHRQKLFQCLPDVCELFKRHEGNQYNSPDYICRKSKGLKNERPPTDSSMLILGGDFSGQTQSKCPPHAFSSMGNRFQIETPLSGCPEFLERPKFLPEYYHMGMAVGQQPQQNSRIVPIPAPTFKPIVSPTDFQSNVDVYNSATMLQTTSPMHRQNVLPTYGIGRRGDPMTLPSFYVNSNDMLDPHHCQSLAGVNPNNSIPSTGNFPPSYKRGVGNAPASISPNVIELFNSQQNSVLHHRVPQGSCDLLMMDDGPVGRVNQASTAHRYRGDLEGIKATQKGHYKSEPSLAFKASQAHIGFGEEAEDYDDDDDDDKEMEQLIGQRHVLEVGQMSFKHPRHAGKMSFEDDKALASIVSSKGRTALLQGNREPIAEQSENYAVSFPKLQASFV